MTQTPISQGPAVDSAKRVLSMINELNKTAQTLIARLVISPTKDQLDAAGVDSNSILADLDKIMRGLVTLEYIFNAKPAEAPSPDLMRAAENLSKQVDQLRISAESKIDEERQTQASPDIEDLIARRRESQELHRRITPSNYLNIFREFVSSSEHIFGTGPVRANTYGMSRYVPTFRMDTKAPHVWTNGFYGVFQDKATQLFLKNGTYGVLWTFNPTPEQQTGVMVYSLLQDRWFPIDTAPSSLFQNIMANVRSVMADILTQPEHASA